MQSGVDSNGAFAEDVVVQATDDQIHSTVEDEAVLLELNSGVYYGVNYVGRFVWEHVQEPRTVGSLISLVAREYGVSAEECRADVIAFCEDLADARLLEVENREHTRQ